MGLATIYGIIKQNKGFITVYSELDFGTTFRIYFPSSQGEVVPNKINAKLFVEHPENYKILIVEDELLVNRQLCLMLEKYGFNIISATSPNEAITILSNKSNKFDLLLTDIVMPKMNGKELAIKAKEIQSEIKVLYMSGYTSDVLKNKSLLEDKEKLIHKPFRREQLFEKLTEILHK